MNIPRIIPGVALALALGASPALADETGKTATKEAAAKKAEAAEAKAEAAEAKADAKEAKKVVDGKPIFLKHKCTMCHEIGTQKILREGKTSADTTWITTVGRAPDLSGVGHVRGEKWIRGWLKKTEAIHGRKHLLMFKGSEEELVTLAKWLESLDDEKTGKALKAREENLK